MNKQLKAYCGDGLLRSILGEIYQYDMFVDGSGGYRLDSNNHLALCWADMKGYGRPHRFGRIKSKKYGTEYEARVYELFLEYGYDSAKTYVSQTIILPFEEPAIN